MRGIGLEFLSIFQVYRSARHCVRRMTGSEFPYISLGECIKQK